MNRATAPQATPQASQQLSLQLVTPDDTARSALLHHAQAARHRRTHGPGIKFRHPVHGDTWTGRGLRPAWVKQALAQGMSLDELRVNPSPEAPAC